MLYTGCQNIWPLTTSPLGLWSLPFCVIFLYYLIIVLYQNYLLKCAFTLWSKLTYCKIWFTVKPGRFILHTHSSLFQKIIFLNMAFCNFLINIYPLQYWGSVTFTNIFKVLVIISANTINDCFHLQITQHLKSQFSGHFSPNIIVVWNTLICYCIRNIYFILQRNYYSWWGQSSLCSSSKSLWINHVMFRYKK